MVLMLRFSIEPDCTEAIVGGTVHGEPRHAMNACISCAVKGRGTFDESFSEAHVL